MVEHMAPGSVIVDLAAERGGNCEVTKTGEMVIEHGVSVYGWINLASSVPNHASQMYARNISAFLVHLFGEKSREKGALPGDQESRQNFRDRMDDEIIRGTLVTQGGEIVNARVREFQGMPALAGEEGKS
jgi:NAD(P) transhydrogenase subunit alpha